MTWSVRIRLSAMMFLQYAIWGAWAPFLWEFLTSKPPSGPGMTDPQAAFIFGLLWLACILAPFTGGQIADRWVPTQWFLAVVHLAGGAVMIAASRTTGFRSMTLLMGLYSLLYAPTLALTNSLGFHHIGDEKQFGKIRVWGTIGWICAGLLLSLWRSVGVPKGVADCLMLSGVLSLVMGVYCLFLPHTPPAKEEAADPLAFREAFVLLKNSNFLVFMLIAFVVTTELQFYYGPTAKFLEEAMKISHARVPLTMALAAQGAEIVAMWLLLPFALRRLGVRKTLALGVIAWPLRYVVFAMGPVGPLAVMQPLVVASLALHGFGYTFFFVVSQIFVDMVAPKDIRASAQSLLTLVTLGIGNWLGTQFTGWVMKVFNPAADVQAWTKVFLVPCVLTVLCAFAFLLFFKDPEKERAPEAEPEAAAV
ncbi:MAG: MFS transporter [Armatimonadota bacterium]